MFPAVLKPFIWIDYSIVALIGVTSSIGTMRGFSREVVSLLCWVVGFWTSLHFSTSISSALQNLISSPNERLAITFISLLVTTILAGSLLEHWLTTRFKQTYNHTAFMERLGGLICGIVQGVLVTAIVVFLAGLTSVPNRLWWHESSLLPSFQILAIWLRDHVATQMAHALTYR
ncbi:MAG: CvpA family protein [Methylococcales bacterium]|nr:CvpA family protein [Methylococcales bacterium]MDD5753647.1 CvpA family protein [Methylococcales bacterium]